MIAKYFETQIKSFFPFRPTEQQDQLIGHIAQFLVDTAEERVFILKGYAGTGKTSLIAALVKALNHLQQKSVLLAPTGRAAKVLSSFAANPAYTIHKKIYRQKALTDYRFELADNLHSDTLFIVDEASMISNLGNDSDFGTGFLLDDLVRYVYRGKGCFMLVMGDVAQLPPVMQNSSPALEKAKLEAYGLRATEFTLTQVVRQAMESGILYNATLLRKALEDGLTSAMPRLKLSGFKDFISLNGMELVDEVRRSYDGVGVEDTIVITRSNKMANLYNKGIRGSVMMQEDEISNGDLLMVTRNNYFWNKPYPEIDFIANGDILRVTRVRKYSEMYGFRFVDLTLESVDFHWEIDARIWLESLYSESPTHANELSQRIFEAVSEDFQSIVNKRERYKLMLENEYLNALQVKFAYAVTCHKAQGGQWQKVFVDMNRRNDDAVDESYYRWLYTALTRASDQIFLVNYKP